MPAHKLNPAQKQAVEYIDGPLLIIAGAGTGKTTVITQKIAYLIENRQAKPEEILAVTFTEKATAEMDERVGDLLKSGTFDIWISTFHGFAQRVLENHALDIGLPNNFKLLDEVKAWLLVRQNLDKFNLDYYRPLGNPAKFIHALITHFQRCKDELLAPADYLKYAEELRLNTDSTVSSPRPPKADPPLEEKRGSGDSALLDSRLRGNDSFDEDEIKRITEVADAYHVYNQLLLEQGALDFADLLFYTVKLFRERPNILREYQSRFKYILVDEFQDTNWAQYEIIKLLAGGGARLTVVGDDDQSIYKFRGASVSNILQFKEDFPGAQEVVLAENYRSGQKILDCAYNFIQLNNPDRLEAKLKVDKKLYAPTQGRGGAVELLLADTAEGEAELVANKIKELKLANPNLAWSDFAILCRANSYAEQFVPALLRAGIPYEFASAAGLYRQKVVLDSLAILRLCDNYHESSAVYRLLVSPVFNLNYDDLSKVLLLTERKTLSLYEAARRADSGLAALTADGAEKVKKFLAVVAKCAEAAKTEPAAKALYKFWEESGYLKLLADNAEKNYRDVFYLQSLFWKIDDFSRVNPDGSARAFLEYVNFILESGSEGEIPEELSSGADAVKVMSAHAAKGLEFAYVFITNLVEQRFPTMRRREPIAIPDALVREGSLPEGDAHLEEERRLFYVALTRAKEGVFLSAAKSYGGARDKKVSRFIVEVEETSKLNFGRKPPGAAAAVSAILYAAPPPLAYAVPDAFSFSQIEGYERCPWQYRFQFVLGIPTGGKGAFSFGNTMHGVMQKFYGRVIELNGARQESLLGGPAKRGEGKNVKAPALDELLKLYEECWQDDWFATAADKRRYYDNGKRILKEFYEQGEREGWTAPVDLERNFRLKLGENKLKGKIDRIDRKSDGTLALIDYKTGHPKEKLSLDEKRQLLLYQIAAASVLELRQLGKVSELTFYYLENNTRQTFLGDAEDLEKTRVKVGDTIAKIKKQDFTPTPDKEICKFCDFRDICDYRA